MSESAFEVQVRLALNAAYHPYGVFWNNKTGWSNGVMVKNHDPFPARGAGDLIGCVMGLWIEVENKARNGHWRKLQKVRRDLVVQCGALYVVCHELGYTSCNAVLCQEMDMAIIRTCFAIEDHVLVKLGPEMLDKLLDMRAAKVAK
jgi:hypothetical protein